MLAVREISFGNHRFDALVRNTGAPRDRLASRLRALEAAGVIERRPYSDRPPRSEYHLTEAGRDLRHVLQSLRAWGDTWAVDEPPNVFVHSCGHVLGDSVLCGHCSQPADPDELTLQVRSPGWSRTGPTA